MKYNYICNTFSKFVAGSIGVSSKSQWGLMPASTYSKELASDYALYKISSYGNPWDRRAFSIVGAFNGSPYMFVGGCYTKSGINEQVIDIRYTYTNPQFIKFYKKEGEVYVFCNAVSSNSNRAWFTSETGLTLISRGNANVIDESYTPIDVKSSVFGYNTIEELSTGVAGLINCKRYISAFNTNTKSLSIDVSNLFVAGDGTPKKWELFIAQWNSTDIAHVAGVCRYDPTNPSLSSALITSSKSANASASFTSKGVFTVSTDIAFSYFSLFVYY